MIVKAVLFDMDGTIVDSVPTWYKTFNQALEQTGGKLITFEYFCTEILGQSTEEDVRRFFPKLTSEQLAELYGQLFPDNIQSVQIFPETIFVLDYLEENGILKGVVTNTPSELMVLTLETLKIKDRFDVILGGNDVSIGKPAPEIIHKACKELKVKEKETIMVGDTKSDTEAGKKAGCHTIGVKTKGDSTVGDLSELVHLLDKLRRE